MAILDPTNPAVWLLVAVFTTPFALLAYWELYAQGRPAATRPQRFAALLFALPWSIFMAGLTYELRQVEGVVAALTWGICLTVLWAPAILGLDYAFEGHPHKFLYREARKLLHPSGGR
jgi:hypothetical protein